MDQGVRDGSRRNLKERWIRGQAVVQKGIEGAIIMFNIMSKNDSILKYCLASATHSSCTSSKKIMTVTVS
jgi:hypothetical protein